MFRWLEKRESGGDEVLVSATKTRCETPPDYKDAQIKKVNVKPCSNACDSNIYLR